MAILPILIACEENQGQVHSTAWWELGSRRDHLSTPWLSGGLGIQLSVAVALLQLVPMPAGLTPAWVLCIGALVTAQTIRLSRLR